MDGLPIMKFKRELVRRKVANVSEKFCEEECENNFNDERKPCVTVKNRVIILATIIKNRLAVDEQLVI
jgi:hypothetical protein